MYNIAQVIIEDPYSITGGPPSCSFNSFKYRHQGNDGIKEMTKGFQRALVFSFTLSVRGRRKLLIEHLLFDWSCLDYDVFCFLTLSTHWGYQLSSSHKHFHKLLSMPALYACLSFRQLSQIRYISYTISSLLPSNS